MSTSNTVASAFKEQAVTICECQFLKWVCFNRSVRCRWIYVFPKTVPVNFRKEIIYHSCFLYFQAAYCFYFKYYT